MNLDFTCQSCDASFELELAELLEDGKIQCPSCDAKAPRDLVDAFTTALDDLYRSLGKLQKKFTTIFAVESEELPPPYDREVGAAPLEDEEEADDDDGDEDGDDEGEEEEWDEDDEDEP